MSQETKPEIWCLVCGDLVNFEDTGGFSRTCRECLENLNTPFGYWVKRLVMKAVSDHEVNERHDKRVD